MINKTHLSMLGFASIDEYFEYVLESRENGQHTQAIELFRQLSEKQSDDFFDWVETTYYYDADDQEQLLTELQNLKNYFK